jgi:hypothetical protein
VTVSEVEQSERKLANPRLAMATVDNIVMSPIAKVNAAFGNGFASGGYTGDGCPATRRASTSAVRPKSQRLRQAVPHLRLE